MIPNAPSLKRPVSSSPSPAPSKATPTWNTRTYTGVGDSRASAQNPLSSRLRRSPGLGVRRALGMRRSPRLGRNKMPMQTGYAVTIKGS